MSIYAFEEDFHPLQRRLDRLQKGWALIFGRAAHLVSVLMPPVNLT
jgi:hypothetical protein